LYKFDLRVSLFYFIRLNPYSFTMSLTLFAKTMEELSVYGDSSFLKFVKDPHKYNESKTDLKLYTLKHFLGLYHDDFYKYHGYYPHYLADEEESEDTEIICLVDISRCKDHTMKKDMRKKYRKAGSHRRRKLREKYSYRNPLNRIHAYIIVQQAPGETGDKTLAINVVCSSNYSDTKGIGSYMMKTTLKAAKQALFINVVLEVGNPEAEENPENIDDSAEESEEESAEESAEESEEEYEDEQHENLESVVDIISSKLWRISVRHNNGIPLYNIGEDYLNSIIHEYLFGETYEYIEWEPEYDDEEYGYGGYYYLKGKICCKDLMKYYESFGFKEDPKVNTEWKCFSIVPFPSMILKL